MRDVNEMGKELPRFLLMENVTNILSKPHAADFGDWKATLENLGFPANADEIVVAIFSSSPGITVTVKVTLPNEIWSLSSLVRASAFVAQSTYSLRFIDSWSNSTFTSSSFANNATILPTYVSHGD